MEQFLEKLSSSEPVPGGGGASALIGAISCALCSMVANLTTGKKKYAQYQNRLDVLIPWLEGKRADLLKDIDKDAEAFLPLAKAYSYPKDQSDYDQVMEAALLQAAETPLFIVEDIYELIPVLEELTEIGSRLAISDVAVGAAACESALKGAVMNVYINTKSMKDQNMANQLNDKAGRLVMDGCNRCQAIYNKICKDLYTPIKVI